MKIRRSKTILEGPRKIIVFELSNPNIAKRYEVSMLLFVREQWRLLDLYAKGKYLIIDGPIADSNGKVIPEQEAQVNIVADMIENTVLNDIPGFKKKIETIIHDYQGEENLSFEFADILDKALRGDTKERFMLHSDMWIYAKIIRTAFDECPYNTAEDLDRRINEIFDDTSLISEFLKQINSRYRNS